MILGNIGKEDRFDTARGASVDTVLTADAFFIVDDRKLIYYGNRLVLTDLFAFFT